MVQPLVGIFDSGIGGRSIEKEIKKMIPGVETIYLADSKNFPYGEKTPSQLKKIALDNTKYLLGKGSNPIVVACNTATVNAIAFLRKSFPEVSFVGVEPAVKPAGLAAKKGIVILSSPKATKSKQVSLLIKKYVRGVKVFNIGSLELVRAVEEGWNDSKVESMLKSILPKKLLSEVDVLVLGCTHFPLIKDKIQKYVGKDIKIIDSGEAVARRVKSLIQ
jgi:glutamate racemase